MASLEHAFVGSSVAFDFDYNKVHQVKELSVDDPDFMWKPTVTATTPYTDANSLNQYPSVAGTAYEYDENGNLISGPFDAEYDALCRLTQVVSGGTTNIYLSDPLNRQVQKEVNTVKTGLLHDGAQLIADYDNTPALVNRYIYMRD